MSKPETKQDWAIRQFKALTPEFMRILLDAPEYGAMRLTIHFHSGAVKRILHEYKESRIPVENEIPYCHK